MTALGGAYDEGSGTDVDRTMAFEWFKAASALGDESASYMLGWSVLLRYALPSALESIRVIAGTMTLAMHLAASLPRRPTLLISWRHREGTLCTCKQCHHCETRQSESI